MFNNNLTDGAGSYAFELRLFEVKFLEDAPLALGFLEPWDVNPLQLKVLVA